MIQIQRKLSLGHKQLEENPWDTFEKVFPVGSYHEATIIKKDDRGAIIQLPYGLEAFAPIKHLRKEDNSSASVEETMTFKVIEFNRDDKRIIVSHSRYLDDIKREASDSIRKEKNQERKATRKNIDNQRSKMEQTTLGELDVFSQIKQQLAADAPAPPPLPKKKEVKVEAPKVEEPKVEEVKEEAPKAKVAPKTKKADKGDDLKKIEGIGPKIAELFNNAGIVTFSDLAGAEVDKLKEILLAAGSRYKMHDPTSWPDQAKMAADGEWDKLKEWQDSHDGGKVK